MLREEATRAATAENPFQDPLRFERRVPECVVVIFGANGDLTKRKLLPALYRLAYDRRLSAGFAVIGISRTPLSDDEFREKMLESVKQFSEDTKFDEDVWKAFAGGLHYLAGRHQRRGPVHEAGDKTGGDRIGAPHRRQRAVLPFHAAQPVRADRARPRQSGIGEGKRMAPPGGREAVRTRSGQRTRVERPPARGVPRIRRLPHRSLPGQRDRPEHPGVSLRQRDLRAAVEPALCEPRADHRRGIDRRGRARRVLPGGRRAGRHDPEPPVAGDGDHRDGAERAVSAPIRCATSDRSCCGRSSG